jgi:small subunit ribosomal protein S5
MSPEKDENPEKTDPKSSESSANADALKDTSKEKDQDSKGQNEPKPSATPNDLDNKNAKEGIPNEEAIKKPDPKKIKEKKREVREKSRGASKDPEFWEPKTKLGKLVKDGTITTVKDALATGLRIREPEIIDILLPELDDEVLDVNMVQRMTDSGRRVRFAIMTVVGNQNGYVGLGSAKGKEVGPAIRKAIDNAKLNIIEIRRGCGSWECGCYGAHSIPFTVDGKSGSTKVTFRPAPRGVGLAVGDVAKHILRLSGIKDAWGFTRGETRTTINYAKAVFMALQNTAKLKTTKNQINNLNIISGALDEEPDTGESDDTNAEAVPATSGVGQGQTTDATKTSE